VIGRGREIRRTNMQVRDPNDDRFSVDYSEIFEAGFYRLKESYPLLFEALEAIHWSMERTPYSDTEKVDVFETSNREIRLFITPRTPRYPALRVLLEITGRRVFLWHVSLRD
jgi:hypothetical protein